MEQFEFKRISCFKWGKTGRGIISCEDAALKSDDLQFAYKSGMSTIQCASVVTETINYYLHTKILIYIYEQLMHQMLLIVLIYLYYLTC